MLRTLLKSWENGQEFPFKECSKPNALNCLPWKIVSSKESLVKPMQSKPLAMQFVARGPVFKMPIDQLVHLFFLEPRVLAKQKWQGLLLNFYLMMNPQ